MLVVEEEVDLSLLLWVVVKYHLMVVQVVADQVDLKLVVLELMVLLTLAAAVVVMLLVVTLLLHIIQVVMVELV